MASDTPLNYYYVGCPPHGLCIIVNNVNFIGLTADIGAEHDVVNIFKTFKRFGYTISVLKDLAYGKYLFMYSFLLYVLSFAKLIFIMFN